MLNARFARWAGALRALCPNLDTRQTALLLSGLHNEKNPARGCGRRIVRTSSGHLVLAKLLPGFWFHPNRTLLSRMFLSRRIILDVVARNSCLAVAP